MNESVTGIISEGIKTSKKSMLPEIFLENVSELLRKIRKITTTKKEVKSLKKNFPKKFLELWPP